MQPLADPGSGPPTGTAAAPPDAAELAPLDPRIRGLWWTSAALLALPAVGAAWLGEALARGQARPGLLTAAVLVLAVTVAVLAPILRYRRWRYALRADALWIRRGVLWVTVSAIPYSRLQFVDTRQGPLDRLFGLAQLVVHTAALGTSGHVPGLAAPEAEQLREHLARLRPDAPPAV